MAGATLNMTNHWKTTCQQAEIYDYNIILRRGYSQSHCSCMDCNLVKNTPFVAKTNSLSSLEAGSGNPEETFTDWFLRMMDQGSVVRLCPDLLYITSDEGTKVPSTKDWLHLAKSHGVAAISEYVPPRPIENFSCSETGLVCDPWGSSDRHLLTPPCCAHYMVKMLKALDKAVTEAGYHFEISHGTLLGAIKVSGFIPWDVDGDLFIPTEAMPYFQIGQPGYNSLLNAGVTGIISQELKVLISLPHNFKAKLWP